MFRMLPTFIIFLISSLSAQAQVAVQARLDSLFDLLEKHDKAMGSIAVHRGGELVYQRAIGMASIESGVRANPGTRYRIGSISKTFTAAMILQLVAEGKVRLDDHLNAYFADLPKSGEITIRHLLQHRSGLVNFTDEPGYTSWLSEARSRDQMLEHFRQHRTQFKPGERMAYSNTNYVLLSYILEKVDGKPFAEILQQRICRPLGLGDTRFGEAIDPATGQARSYHRALDWEDAGETHPSIPMGAGGLVSTPRDLNRFYRALLRGEIIPTPLTEEMKRLEDGFGLGLIRFPFGQRFSYGHTGGIDGYNAIAGYFPEEDLAVSWTGNALATSMNDILIGVLSIVFDEPYTLPDFAPAFVPSEATLKSLEGVYSSPVFPLKISIRATKGTLVAQATGQPSFSLDAHSDTEYRYEAAGVVLEFHPEDGAMTLNQGQLKVRMNREAATE